MPSLERRLKPPLASATCRGTEQPLERAHSRAPEMLASLPVYNSNMSSRAQDVLREALALPLDERADVAAELLASLDDAAAERPADVEAAWAAEIERRVRRALADESGGIPWDDVRHRAEAELRRR